jgi:ParB family chromosome partitioning protein
MAVKRRGLGRGLDALLTSVPEGEEGVVAADALEEIELDAISAGRYQPRSDMDPDALEALAQSIRTQGIVQPIVVRPHPESESQSEAPRYELIAGERRWRASRIAGLATIPALVREVPDQIAMAVGLIENIQRENLNPLEEAAALRRLIDECAMTHQACAEAVGRSRAAVSNLLRLMDLNEDVREFVRRGDLEMGHARALLALEGDAQSYVAHQVVDRGLSVRGTETLVRDTQRGKEQGTGRTTKPRDPRLASREEALIERLQSSVQIKGNARGGGKLVISYRNLGELDKLIERFD